MVVMAMVAIAPTMAPMTPVVVAVTPAVVTPVSVPVVMTAAMVAVMPVASVSTAAVLAPVLNERDRLPRGDGRRPEGWSGLRDCRTGCQAAHERQGNEQSLATPTRSDP